MGFFNDYLPTTGDKLLTKWAHYFEVYERELTRFRSRPVRFLEIGIFRGGSIPMWKEFFHDESTLVFIDIDPACVTHAIEGTHVRIGDQSDPEFLRSVIEEFGPFDIVLDDGSHINRHQITSFEAIWPAIDDRGVYVVEDCHTSYWPGFGGGYRNEASFMEFAKRMIDRLHSWYTDQDELFEFDPIAKDLLGVRIYDSIVVFEKRLNKEAPISLQIQNGEVQGSRAPLTMRNRTSMFRGRDGG
ncbi:class I SAM-dependent methyltransferase [Novosphingopyxis iocasae]|uniref:class I SAM-dependent methyltransferase n=1 Tax=Novosphingopyxis iocasae TaxID=2762729 RepID=UPI0016519B95|nr:class I SAM-dependent methyltransferase [Novosphingopyxis iocasae]